MGCTPSYAVSRIEEKAYQGPPEADPRVTSDDSKDTNPEDTLIEKDVSTKGLSKWSLIRSVKPRPDRHRDQSAVTFNMDRTFLVDAFVKMIISDGQPFGIVSESGMKMLVGPLLEALEVSLDEETLRKEVIERARKIRESISNDVSERLVSLKVDVICRRSRPFVGISIHYVKSGRKRLRILGVKEISAVHNPRELKGIIWHLLSDYGIAKEQLYTVTVDNGSNPLRVPWEINKSETAFEEKENEEEENNDDKQTAIAITASLRDAFFAEKETESNSVNIECLTTTMQSMARGAITTQPESKKLVEKARSISNKLQTKSVKAILESKGTKLALIDNRNRWQSTFVMVERLSDHELRQVINEMGVLSPDLNISPAEWDKMEKFIQAYKLLVTFSVRSADPRLTIGDFYKDWLKCKMETQKLDSVFAHSIVEHMKKAEEKMLKNRAFLAAVYLDPRIWVTLTDAQTEIARQYLEHVWKTVRSVSRLETENKTPDVEEEAEPGTSFDDDLEVFLRSKDRNHVKIKTNPNVLSSHFKNYEDRPREKYSANVIQYWKEFGQESPELHQLAMIALACPANQAGLERIWSGVRFMLNPSYVKLPEDILDDVILVNTNQPII